ncbi:MAG: RNA methyltransferase [Pirellulales bacterium]
MAASWLAAFALRLRTWRKSSAAVGRRSSSAPTCKTPKNLGAIVRLAAAFQSAGILLGPHCADPFSRRVQRVSMGNVYRMPIVPVDDVPTALTELREQHAMPSWATALDADAEAFAPQSRPERLAIVFGSEGHGVPRDVVAACDRRVTIPMPPGVDSLNVAVAAGIFLYELTRPLNHRVQ